MGRGPYGGDSQPHIPMGVLKKRGPMGVPKGDSRPLTPMGGSLRGVFDPRVPMGVPKWGSGHPNEDHYREGALWGSLRGGFPPYTLMGVLKGGVRNPRVPMGVRQKKGSYGGP